jgi:hypothetical protein
MAKGVAVSYNIDGYEFTGLEAEFWQNWKDTGLPMPTPEYRFNKPRSQHRFDFAWPDVMVSVELEGGIYSNGGHTRGSGYIKNLLKYNLAAEMGWVVLRYHQTNPDAIAQVARVYKAREAARLLPTKAAFDILSA